MNRTLGRPEIIGRMHSPRIVAETQMTLGQQTRPTTIPQRRWRTVSTFGTRNSWTGRLGRGNAHSARRPDQVQSTRQIGQRFFFFLQMAAPLLLTAHLRFFAQHMPD